MKFSTVAVACIAMVCSTSLAFASEQKGVPLVMNPADFPGHKISSDVAKADPNNPYVKVKGTGDNGLSTAEGAVGVAFSVNASDSSSSESSTSGWTIPLAAAGCAAAAVGIAGFVVMKKRQAAAAAVMASPADDPRPDMVVDYDTEMITPV
ncbi:hypothetical protein ATCC90586_000679 [Pythium insidiosum]|nr:hypothetical protein ATCC90586_000679 [Pythium insidiosum]